MKKKKRLLEWDESSDQNNFIGIVSSSSHLGFVHNLNKTEYFDFERSADFEKIIENETLYFIKYEHEDSDNSNRYVLLKNKGIGGTLGKEFKGLDFILVQNTENAESLNTIKEFLLSQKFIQAVVEIGSSKISEFNKQLLEI